MPSHHVIVGGKWTKVGIKKNFTGDVVKRGRLYDKVVEDYNSLENNTLADSNKFVKKIDFTNEPSIYYYYYGNPDVDTENNILIEDANHQNYVYYGGFCWKMIRTTENQGVKLLYYGTYEEGMCSIKLLGRTRFAKSGSLISESGYMYNRDYKDRKPRIFSEPSDLERGQGIYEKNDNIDINNSGAIYDETTYYYSDSVKYVNGEYVLQDPELKQWRDFKNDLKGFYTCASMIEKSCAKVHYIVGSGGIVTGSKVRYFYIELNNGQTLADVDIEMKLSKNATKNSDNTYTLNEPISNIKLSEFHKNDWKGYYICPDTTKSTCANMQYITYAKAGYPYVFINTSNVYKYANDVIYENGKYRLIDTAISPIKEVWNWEDEYLNLKKNKYTCFNDSGICDEVYYINHFTISENFGTQNTTYFTLNEGRKIEDILNEAIGFKEYDGGYYPRDTEIDINKLDSAIKIKVDEWYEQNIKGQEFENYLENPIFCNNRRLKDFYQQGFSPNVEGSSDLIYLDIAKDSLTCDHLNDRFTVNDESYKFTKSNSDIKNNGNGKLKYPIGLIDDYEIYLIGKGNTYYGANYWTLSPNNHDFHHGGSRIRSFKRSNHFDYFLSWENLEYRPVISLKYDAEYAGGTGAITNPYRIRGLFE